MVLLGSPAPHDVVNKTRINVLIALQHARRWDRPYIGDTAGNCDGTALFGERAVLREPWVKRLHLNCWRLAVIFSNRLEVAPTTVAFRTHWKVTLVDGT
jgi:hypothetical protein